MPTRERKRRKNSGRDFYQQALDEARKCDLEEASHIEGIDQEIALLRLKFRELLEQHPERIDLHLKAASIIARLVKIQYQITSDQKKSLREAVQKVLTEVAVPLGVGIGIKAATK